MSRLRKQRWQRWMLEIAVVFALLVAANAWHTRHAPSGPAPEFSGTLLDGTPISLAGLRGKPVLLHFWATWCPICGLEQGTIDSLAKDHAVLSVAMDTTSADAIRAYMRTRGVDYRVLHDAEQLISSHYAIRGVPTSFILDSAGRIRFVAAGYSSEPGLRLRLWWAGLP